MKHARLLIDELPGLIGGDQPGLSVDEIAEALGRNPGAVGNLVRKLRRQEQKALYIAAWRRSKGSHISLWKWGNLPDALALPNLSNAEVCERYRSTDKGRETHNRSGRRWYRKNNGAELRRAWRKNRDTLRVYSERGVAGIDPLLAAIMGIPA